MRRPLSRRFSLAATSERRHPAGWPGGILPPRQRLEAAGPAAWKAALQRRRHASVNAIDVRHGITPSSPSMSRALIAVALSSLFALAAAAQVNEVIEVRVVEVEVVVTDAHGKPVSGLTKNDFELREGGKPREITNFYAVDRGEIRR